MPSTTRPRLYHDIDGVLFGSYSIFPGARPLFQLRPGVSDWFRWVLARFDLVWVTTWPADEVERLLVDGLYLDEVWKASRYLPWQTDPTLGNLDTGEPPTKAAAVRRDLVGYDGVFLWLDDCLPEFPVDSFGKSPLSFVQVPDQGMQIFTQLADRCRARLEQLQRLAASSDGRLSHVSDEKGLV